MKISAYSAGVIGCELAHMFMKAGRPVTLLARSNWKDNPEKNGLVIRYYALLRTTQVHVRVLDELRLNDVYPLTDDSMERFNAFYQS